MGQYYFQDPVLNQISHFVDGIGIKVVEGQIEEPTFLPGYNIKDGIIIVDESKCMPGDLLHEAGHLAVRTPENRLTFPTGTDEGEEMMAIAWSAAAAYYINIPLDVLFHDHGYKGESDWLREHFSYFDDNFKVGVPCLQWKGMTLEPMEAKKRGMDPYPHMLKWVL